MLLDEYNLVVERSNGLEVTRATLTQLAVSSILHKRAGEVFTKNLDSMNVVTRAREVGSGGG